MILTGDPQEYQKYKQKVTDCHLLTFATVLGEELNNNIQVYILVYKISCVRIEFFLGDALTQMLNILAVIQRRYA